MEKLSTLIRQGSQRWSYYPHNWLGVTNRGYIGLNTLATAAAAVGENASIINPNNYNPFWGHLQHGSMPATIIHLLLAEQVDKLRAWRDDPAHDADVALCEMILSPSMLHQAISREHVAEWLEARGM